MNPVANPDWAGVRFLFETSKYCGKSPPDGRIGRRGIANLRRFGISIMRRPQVHKTRRPAGPGKRLRRVEVPVAVAEKDGVDFGRVGRAGQHATGKIPANRASSIAASLPAAKFDGTPPTAAGRLANRRAR